MKKTPVYEHPDFVVQTDDLRREKENKRLWLSLTIDNDSLDSVVVILKNPSRATAKESDKTVSNVTNYIHKNRMNYQHLKNVGKIFILNLIPFYETDSSKLVFLKEKVIDKENHETINEFCSKHKNVIIAWGNHPKGLYNEYEYLKKLVRKILKTNNNNIFYVDKFSKNDNPKHGQVWGYKNRLIEFKL